MLQQVADGVWVHQSEWMQTNSVIVRGRDGALVIDPGIHGGELADIARELDQLGLAVVAGFSTHPHWDHLLWHPALGNAPRYSSAAAAETVTARLADGLDARRAQLGIPDDTPLDLVGQVTALPTGTAQVPWDGPIIRILEHSAHAPGHAALLVEARGVLVAGDMLSDVLIPMLDLSGPNDPIGDYLHALDLLESFAEDIDFVIPGHGSIGDGPELQARINHDRDYVIAVRDGGKPDDPRIGPDAKPGWDWVGGLHERQAAAFVSRRDPGSANV